MTTYDDGPSSKLWEPLNKAVKETTAARVAALLATTARDQRDAAIYMCLAQGATDASVAERTGLSRETVVQRACDWANANAIPWARFAGVFANLFASGRPYTHQDGPWRTGARPRARPPKPHGCAETL